MKASKERLEHYKKLREACRPACPKGHGPTSNTIDFAKVYLPVTRELPCNTKQKTLVEV